MRATRALAAGLLLLLAGACGDSPHHPVVVRTVASTTTVVTTAATTTTSEAPLRRPRASRSLQRPRTAVGLDEDTKRRVIAAIYSYADWDPARMVRVASCESGLSPRAVNGSHHGIFQISGATLGLIEEHVALAHSIWQRRGMQPWECKG